MGNFIILDEEWKPQILFSFTSSSFCFFFDDRHNVIPMRPRTLQEKFSYFTCDFSHRLRPRVFFGEKSWELGWDCATDKIRVVIFQQQKNILLLPELPTILNNRIGGDLFQAIKMYESAFCQLVLAPGPSKHLNKKYLRIGCRNCKRHLATKLEKLSSSNYSKTFTNPTISFKIFHFDWPA